LYYIVQIMITLVHIGKCGGESIKTILKNLNITFETIHIKECIFNSNKKYLIMLRNPINRFISAFYWRYKLVINDKLQSDRFKGEKEILEYYKSANNLAENIFNFDINKSYIHHIKEDIYFYIGEFLKNCKKENIIGIITTETINNDILKIFNIHNTIHKNKSYSYDKNLSTIGYNNLKKYLAKDYECISKLYDIGLLSEEKYNFLSI